MLTWNSGSPCGVRQWLRLWTLQLVGLCTRHRASLHRDLGARPDSGRGTDCPCAVYCGGLFQKTYNSRVKFDVWWQHYACATYGVIENAVYEEGHVCHNFTDPVRVGTLPQCPLKDIRFLYSFQEILESFGVRDQARFVEASTTTVSRTMIVHNNDLIS